MSRTFLPTCLVGLVVAMSSPATYACTAITLTAEDGTVIQARTEEWGAFDLKSQLMIVPRGVQFTGTTPDHQPGLQWQGKYGVLGVNGFGRPIPIDGMNEKGLTLSVLYLAGLAEFEPYEPSLAANSISQSEFPIWALTSFATTEEVRHALQKVRVVPVAEAKLGGIPAPIHFILTDAAGKTIVVEATKGKVNVYDNPVGVLTNNPEFPWHLTNLGNYVGLQAAPEKAIKVGELVVKPLGVGSGMLGLPGDYTPPSRFLRAVALRNTVRPMGTGERAVEEAFRILNNFDIPLGAVAADAKDDTLGSTQWTTAMDTKSLRYYYRTMYNHRIRVVDMKKIDFGQGDIRFQPMDAQRKQDYKEVTVK